MTIYKYSSRGNPLCCCLILLLHAYSHDLISQFTDVTDNYGLAIFHDISVSESGVSFHDFDRDGLDDLTYASSGFGVFTYRNTGNGFEQVYYFPFIDGKTLHPIWVDYDNDGDADFFATRAWQCPVLFQNQGDQSFIDVSDMLPCPASGIVSTCASWGDYDNDNFLDVYVSNYNPLEDYGSPNWLFHNNGDGSFTEVGEEMGVAYGNFPAYQSIFIDTDFDRDQDLLVVNDKYDGCKFFRNDGGYFSEIGQENGFDVHIEAMSLSVSDFDHDGDYDYYISNTIEGNVFLVNQNGIFTNLSAQLGTLVNANCWGSIFLDREMKTWEDLYVVSTGPTEGVNVMLKNAAGSIFFEQYESLNFEDTEYSYAIAKGDANNDGAYDIMSMPYYANGSLLFQSNGPSSTFVKIIPIGTISNRDGIGATIRLFADDIQQIRPVTCGENFTSQDSKSIIFGTNSSSVDSIIIEWPSGWTDTWYNLELNNVYLLTEGASYTTQDTIFYSLCNNESIILDAGSGSSFLWSDGVEDSIREVFETGEYHVSISNEFGLIRELIFMVNSSVDIPIIQVMNDTCNNAVGAITVSIPNTSSIQWEDGSAEDTLNQLNAGYYSYVITNQYNCNLSGIVYVDNVTPWTYEVTTDTACYGNTAQYNISTNNNSQTLILSGVSTWFGELPAGSYSFTIIDPFGCSVQDSILIYEYDEIHTNSYYEIICNDGNDYNYIINSEASGGTPPYFPNYPIPHTLFDAGTHTIIWEDNNGCIDSSQIEIDILDSIQLQLEISNLDENIAAIATVIGGVPPYSYEWNEVQGSHIFLFQNSNYLNVIVTDSVGCYVSRDTSLIISSFDKISDQFSSISLFKVYDTSAKLFYESQQPQSFHSLRAVLARGIYIIKSSERTYLVRID